MKKMKKKWKSAAIIGGSLPSIYDLTNKSLEAGLWCLCVAKEVYKYKHDYFSCEDIGTILQEYLDVPLTENQIKKAFARAGNKIIKGRCDDGYKISQPGEKYLKSQKKDEPISIFYLRPSKPLQAKHTLETLVKNIPKGELRICDPFYGTSTFQVLEMILRYHKNVKFLTAAVGGGEKKFNIQQVVNDFKQEYESRAKIKILNKNDTHDRYILAKNLFFIIGQGIKDLGNKESLIIAVEDRYGRDIRKTLINEFDRRWNEATIL